MPDYESPRCACRIVSSYLGLLRQVLSAISYDVFSPNRVRQERGDGYYPGRLRHVPTD